MLLLIEIKGLNKTFDNIKAISDVTININQGEILGLVGSNGSGKSSILRLLSGVYNIDSGEILLDGQGVFDNAKAKEDIFLVPDWPYFFPNYDAEMIAKLYSKLYKKWDFKRFEDLCSIFPIDKSIKTVNMSKGMKKQLAFIIAVSSGANYILLDEIFDGIDPVIRVILKQTISDEVKNKSKSFIIASHSLKEIEDMCNHVGLLHNGKMILIEDLSDAKLGVYKVQVSFTKKPSEQDLLALDIIKMEDKKRLMNLLIKGEKEEILKKIEKLNPEFVDLIPLTLEEIFISEMEVLGYDFKD